MVAVSVTAGGGRDLLGAVHAACQDMLAVLQRWLGWDQAAPPVLAVITRGAVAAVPGDAGGDLAGVAVCGLVRSAQSEEPGRFVLADIDHAQASVAALPAIAGTGESQLAIRDGELLAARLTRLPAADTTPATDTTGGTETAGSAVAAGLAGGRVLVSGGTGRLGGLVAGHLAARYQVAELVLASDRGPGAPGVAQLAAQLAGGGTGVRVAAADVTDQGAATGLTRWAAGPGELAGHAGSAGPCGPGGLTGPCGPGGLAGVVHLDGTAADAAIGTLDARLLAQVLAPKANGAWHLHEATAGMNLAAFVTFSSAAGMLGSPGQGNDAAGGTFLEALAGWRQRRGLPALSLAWAVTGHLAESDLARIRTAGMVPVAAPPRPGTARRRAGRGSPGGAGSQDRHRGAGRPGPHQPAARAAPRPGPRPGRHRVGQPSRASRARIGRAGRPAGRP